MVAGSKVEALEVEVMKLKRGLITVMDEANIAKEKTKTLANELKVEKQLTVQKDKQLHATNQKVKSMAAKVVQVSHLNEEYNIVLFSWY